MASAAAFCRSAFSISSALAASEGRRRRSFGMVTHVCPCYVLVLPELQTNGVAVALEWWPGPRGALATLSLVSTRSERAR